jgi:hypothetical protein
LIKVEILTLSLVSIDPFLDELWNLYLDFCVQRLSQAPDSTKNEVRKDFSEVKNTVPFI